MRFYVVENRRALQINPISIGFLVADNWNDWFKYQTLYRLIIFDENSVESEIGDIKIGQFGWAEDQSRPLLNSEFEKIGDQFFSLGQDDSYYENLKLLGDEIRQQVLVSLNDLALNENLYQRALEEDVTRTSLLRSVSESSVTGQFRRIAQGGARLTAYSFEYTPKQRVEGIDAPPPVLSFDVTPESQPPTNIHVLIGRNGVGKTYLLQGITSAIVGYNPDPAAPAGEISFFDLNPFDEVRFASLISVTFSAFDPFQPLPEPKDKTTSFRYYYVGLKHKTLDGEGRERPPKTPEQLGREFSDSVRICLQGSRLHRWSSALELLESDPIFRQAEVQSIIDLANEQGPDVAKNKALEIFRRLSSGHKIVLLTLTRLIETVEEKSVVVIDEPEAHLHPPLLSAFIRALSNLLTDRNGAAIIATHSPVILQEVPKSCAWIVDRSGPLHKFSRPDVETFGENVGVLTREVFQLEVTHSGFHRLLREAVSKNRSYEDVLGAFSGNLGAEAKAIVRALLANDEAG